MSSETPPTVLVVDDEPSVLDLFRIYLEDDYRVLTAADGDEALDRIDDTVDVVLLDRRMPGMPGSEVLDEIRGAGHDAMVAMVTAVVPDFDIVDLGFDDYLRKPVTDTDLKECVEDLLAIGQYDAAVRECYSLSSKIAALESGKSGSELQNSPELGRLTSRLQAVQREAQTHFDDMPSHDLEVMFGRLNKPD